MKRLVLFVEGEGDVDAVPALEHFYHHCCVRDG